VAGRIDYSMWQIRQTAKEENKGAKAENAPAGQIGLSGSESVKPVEDLSLPADVAARGSHAFLPPAQESGQNKGQEAVSVIAAAGIMPAANFIGLAVQAAKSAPALPEKPFEAIFAQAGPAAGRKNAGKISPKTAEERQNLLRGTLVARDLTKKYRGRSVVNGVSFGVRAGEAVGILGPNGAGKTTCFYMVTGLVPADSGIIEIDGFDVTTMPMYRRARLGVGYLPQEASIFRGLSVEDNIKAVLEVVEKDRKRRQADLDALLEEFKIAHLRHSMAIALSGGERRRLEIARALASRPNFMLLDEPFAGIDPIAIADIQQLVRHLTRRGIGVLITDHNVRETLGLVDRAYIIHAGKVLTHGRPDEIVANADVRRLYLGDAFSL